MRDQALPLLMELTAPISLTAGRRLQLAAQASELTRLCLIPEEDGQPGSRDAMALQPGGGPDQRNEDSTLQI
ncbi:MAG: hypothetical protein R3D03_21490 [Geminicoccaceae bacterium]